MPLIPGTTLDVGSLNERLRRITTSEGPALTTMLLVPLPESAALPPPRPSMVIPEVMIAGPKSPGSRTSISPPAMVLDRAAASVLHGSTRPHVLPSSPTPDTQVRTATMTPAGVRQESPRAGAAVERNLRQRRLPQRQR